MSPKSVHSPAPSVCVDFGRPAKKGDRACSPQDSETAKLMLDTGRFAAMRGHGACNQNGKCDSNGNLALVAQEELLRWDPSLGTEFPDSNFGPATVKEVRRFQEQYNLQHKLKPGDLSYLKVDGKVGKYTWAALKEQSKPIPSPKPLATPEKPNSDPGSRKSLTTPSPSDNPTPSPTHTTEPHPPPEPPATKEKPEPKSANGESISAPIRSDNATPSSPLNTPAQESQIEKVRADKRAEMLESLQSLNKSDRKLRTQLASLSEQNRSDHANTDGEETFDKGMDFIVGADDLKRHRLMNREEQIKGLQEELGKVASNRDKLTTFLVEMDKLDLTSEQGKKRLSEMSLTTIAPGAPAERKGGTADNSQINEREAKLIEEAAKVEKRTDNVGVGLWTAAIVGGVSLARLGWIGAVHIINARKYANFAREMQEDFRLAEENLNNIHN